MGFSILAEADRLPLENGMSLRLLSAFEVLQARREAEEMMGQERERAICSNACLLAKALEVDDKSVFSNGEAVLVGLCVEEIATLSRQWGEFNRRVNPSTKLAEADMEVLKKN